MCGMYVRSKSFDGFLTHFLLSGWAEILDIFSLREKIQSILVEVGVSGADGVHYKYKSIIKISAFKNKRIEMLFR